MEKVNLFSNNLTRFTITLFNISELETKENKVGLIAALQF